MGKATFRDYRDYSVGYATFHYSGDSMILRVFNYKEEEVGTFIGSWTRFEDPGNEKRYFDVSAQYGEHGTARAYDGKSRLAVCRVRDGEIIRITDHGRNEAGETVGYLGTVTWDDADEAALKIATAESHADGWTETYARSMRKRCFSNAAAAAAFLCGLVK